MFNRIWHLITNGADEHIALALMWYVKASEEKIVSCATVVANMMVKVAMNTTPLPKWQNGMKAT
jgi:hypothetical protein